jgi:hypothetical protein
MMRRAKAIGAHDNGLSTPHVLVTVALENQLADGNVDFRYRSPTVMEVSLVESRIGSLSSDRTFSGSRAVPLARTSASACDTPTAESNPPSLGRPDIAVAICKQQLIGYGNTGNDRIGASLFASSTEVPDIIIHHSFDLT